MLNGAEVAARTLGVRPQFVEARGPADFDRAFSDMTRARAGALTMLGSAMFFGERRRLVDLAAKHRLPAVYTSRDYVDAGGLMAYGPNLADLSRRGATYVHKILKGAKAADLPVENPTKLELVINLKTAKASASRSRRRCWRGRIKSSNDGPAPPPTSRERSCARGTTVGEPANDQNASSDADRRGCTEDRAL